MIQFLCGNFSVHYEANQNIRSNIYQVIPKNDHHDSFKQYGTTREVRYNQLNDLEVASYKEID